MINRSPENIYSAQQSQPATGYVQALLLSLCVIAHSVFTYVYAVTRMYTYKTSLTDTGTLMQVLWSIVHRGLPLCTTNAPFTPENWFGFHFSPIYLILLPFYTLWPHAELLQIAQSLCFGASGLVLFYTLKAAGAKDSEAWVGSFLYWLNPYVLGAAIWDFHEITFSTLFIALALFGLCAERFRVMLLALILLLLTKEHYGLSVAGIGFLWGWRTRNWWQAACIMALGLISLVVLIKFIIPFIHGGPHFMWTHTGGADRYSWMGDPWPAKLHMLYHLGFEDSEGNIPGIVYLKVMLLSVLMLPLAAPLYLAPAASDLLANLLSVNTMPRHLITYHNAPLIPVMVLSAYQGYRFLIQKLPHQKYALYGVLALMVALLPGLVVMPFKVWELHEPHLALSPADQTAITHIDMMIEGRNVTVQSDIGMFFAQRAGVYPFPDGTNNAYAVILHLDDTFTSPNRNHPDQPFNEPAKQFFMQLRGILAQPDWHMGYWQAPWLVLLHGKATVDEQVQREDIARHISALEKRENAP